MKTGWYVLASLSLIVMPAPSHAGTAFDLFRMPDHTVRYWTGQMSAWANRYSTEQTTDQSIRTDFTPTGSGAWG